MTESVRRATGSEDTDLVIVKDIEDFEVKIQVGAKTF